MPFLKRPDGEIYHEEYGQGFPILLPRRVACAPVEMWPPGRTARRDPGTTGPNPGGRPSRDRDGPTQRGQSRTAIEDHGWHTYAADHMALMDHLGIGGSIRRVHRWVSAKAVETAPDRVVSRCEPDRRAPSIALFSTAISNGRGNSGQSGRNWTRRRWSRSAQHVGPRFVFCVDRSFVRNCPCRPSCCRAPTSHPAATSDELRVLLRVSRSWTNGADGDWNSRAGGCGFPDRHTPR